MKELSSQEVQTVSGAGLASSLLSSGQQASVPSVGTSLDGIIKGAHEIYTGLKQVAVGVISIFDKIFGRH